MNQRTIMIVLFAALTVAREAIATGKVVLDSDSGIVAAGQISAAAREKAELLAPGDAYAGSDLQSMLPSTRAAVEALAAASGKAYDATPILRQLAALETKLQAAGLDEFQPLRMEFLALQKRALVTENPLLKGRDLLFVERPQYREDHHNTATMFQKGEINEGSFPSCVPARLKRLNLTTGEVKTLLATETGSIRDPEVSFDGKKILFSYRKSQNDWWHIYEMNAGPSTELRAGPSTDLRAGGSGMTQLTSLEGVTDIDPFYLSDGSIAFGSTREPKFCACNRHIMANLFKMEADGANIVQIGKSIEHEAHGIQLPDGRLLYNRWEYIDRNFGGAQGLWTSGPAGANHALYMWQSTPFPLLNARPIPGSNKVIAIISACHSIPVGALVLLDRNRGIEGSAPVVRTWPASAKARIDNPRAGFDEFKSLELKYEDPFALSETFFLVARTKSPTDPRMAIYLVDTFGNETLVQEGESIGAGARGPALGCFDPMLIAPSPVPANVAGSTDYSRKDGTFLLMNAYEGTHMKGVVPGSIAYLRVVDNPPKMTWTRAAYAGAGTQAPAMNWHDFGNKHVLATFPVEEDGSIQFTAPIDRFIYFQLLDKDGKMIQSMRSGVIVQPGEVNSCIGCHEDRYNAPPPPRRKMTAMAKPAHRFDPTVLQQGCFSYARDVQPIFDKHCISCHDYGKDGGRTLNLSGDRTSIFNVSYHELNMKKYTGTIGGGPDQILEAFSWGSHVSKLIQTLDKGHPNMPGEAKVRLTSQEYQTLITWLDLNAPYYPDYTSAYPDNPGGRSALTGAEYREIQTLAGNPKVAWFSVNAPILINFTRPALSPILDYMKDRPDAYRRALELITEGKARYAMTPRNDMPGYKPSPVDQARLDRYAELFQRELRAREAIVKGEKIYDPGMGPVREGR